MKNMAKKRVYRQQEYFTSKGPVPTRFGMQPFAGNYSNDRRFAKTLWLCLRGKEQEEEQHILSGHCEVYGDLTERFNDLSDQNQLTQFFF